MPGRLLARRRRKPRHSRSGRSGRSGRRGIGNPVDTFVVHDAGLLQQSGLVVVAADHALQVFPARVRGAAVDEIGPSDGRGVDGHRDMFHGVGAQSAGVFGSVFRSGLADREPDAAVTLHHGGLFRGVHPGVVGDRCRRAVKEVSGDFRRAVDAAVRDVAARIVERDGLLRTVVPRFAVAGSGLPDRRDVGELLSDQSFGAGVAERHGRRGAGEISPP